MRCKHYWDNPMNDLFPYTMLLEWLKRNNSHQFDQHLPLGQRAGRCMLKRTKILNVPIFLKLWILQLLSYIYWYFSGLIQCYYHLQYLVNFRNFRVFFCCLPVAVTISETKKLRSTYDKTETHVQSLMNIGISSETYGSFLSPASYMAKIPEEWTICIIDWRSN